MAHEDFDRFDIFGIVEVINSQITLTGILANLIVDAANFTVAEVERGNLIVTDLLGLSIGNLAEDLARHDGDVLAAFADQSDALTQVVNGSESRLKESILEAFLSAQVESDRSSADIIRTLTGVIVANAGVITSSTDRAVSSILDGQRFNQSILDSLESIILSGLGDLGGGLKDVLDILGDGIRTTIENRIIIDDSVFGTVIDTVKETILESLEQNAGVLETVTSVLGAVISDVVRTVGDTLLEQVPELRQIWQAIRDVGGEQIDVLEKANDRTRAGMGASTTRSTIEELEPGLEATAEQLKESYVDFLGGPEGLACLTEEERDLILNGVNVSGVGKRIIDIASLIVGPIFMTLALAQARAQRMLYNWQECNPVHPLPPAETIIAWQRELITDAEAQSNLEKQGFSADDSERLINVGFTAPDLSLVYAMWLRDEIDDGAFTELLKMLGYAESMLGPIKKLAFFIPPVQDLITMAVREVFTPEIAEAQGQFEDFPEDFAKFAKQQGVSREWALNYWAAHWSLPSVQMGFEMLHRGVIDQEQLNTLMRALDIMPGWREPLTRISFTPFTRVDIRRMHRLGVLDESEVLRAYKDIGYDDEKAAIQLEFVLAANQEDELVTLDVASDLTRSSILSFYSDGIISRTVAFGLLIQAGINVAAAELFLLGADFDIERRERRLAVDLVLDRFRFGGRNETESSDEIRQLGFESREQELALLDLERLTQQETKLPSKGDLDKFLGAGIIEPAEYVDQLERQGFSSLWAGRYLQLELEGG